jgi:hypothetical protein
MKDELEAQGRGGVARTSHFAAVPLLALLLMAVMASSASASNLQAVISQIGSTTPSAYTVTIHNEGETTEGPVLITFGGESHAAVSGVVPSSCAFDQPVPDTIGCPALSSGATLQLCYIGPPAAGGEVFGGKAETFAFAPSFTVSSCPVPGFTAPAAGGTPPTTPGSTPPAPAATTPPPAADGTGSPLTLGKVTDNAKQGTATLLVTVSEAGSVGLSGPGVKDRTVKAKGAGTVRLTVKATGSSATKLAQAGKVTLKVSITFTPGGGPPTTLKKKVKLLKS